MTTFIAIYITLLGLTLGSFLNVVGLRIPAGESLLHPPSKCPKCRARLKTMDLIPVLSYLLARGKCRHCGTRVSPVYPFGEAITGVLFLVMYLKFGLTFEGVTGMLLVCLSVAITVSDIRYMLIPDKVLLFFCTTLPAFWFLLWQMPHYGITCLVL
ncbi:prepilin peptidase [Paenibacillus rhizoplanae]